MWIDNTLTMSVGQIKLPNTSSTNGSLPKMDSKYQTRIDGQAGPNA